MRTSAEIIALLDELEHVIADDLEDWTLDFKACPKDPKEMVRVVYEGVICFANSRGGTLVLGVNDKVKGRREAIGGVPANLDLETLQRQIFDTTDPPLTPHLEKVQVPEGELLLIHVPAMPPPVTSTRMPTTRRVGKNCLPFTGSQMRATLERDGLSDFTAQVVRAVHPLELVSAAEMERLRDFGRSNFAPPDLLAQGDLELLSSLGLIRDAELTYAGVLLVGRREALRQHVPNHE